MKKHFYFIALSLSLLGALLSCNKHDNHAEAERLHSVLNAENKSAADFFSMMDSHLTSQTKSSEIPFEVLEIPDWAYDYFLQYTQSNSLDLWDEYSICNLLANDSALNNDQKIFITTILGDISALKDFAINNCPEMQTKSREADCRQLYYQKVKETIIGSVSTGAIGGSLFSGLVGAELGLIGGMINAIRDIKELGREYIRCSA